MTASWPFWCIWPKPCIAWLQADVIVQFDDLILGLLERRAILVIEIVGVGDDGVEAVVAAGHFDDDEDVVLALFGGQGGVVDEAGHDLPEGQQRGAGQRAFQQFTAR